MAKQDQGLPAEASAQAGVPVWPQPRQMKFSGEKLSLGTPLSLRVKGDAGWLKTEAGKAAVLLNRAAGATIIDTRKKPGGKSLTITSSAVVAMATMAKSAADALPKGRLKPVKKDEGYALAVTPRGITLAGCDAAGVFYGAQTLSQLIEANGAPSLPGVTIRDWPRFPIRGVHMYLPPRSQFGFFRRLLDYLAGYKYNTIYLEVSGGMEYERHPEVNRAWKQFCKEAEAYDPKKDKHTAAMASTFWGMYDHPMGDTGPVSLQCSRYFPKDSTHTELAGGEWLTKKEIRKIIAECRKRHIQIIPEVQSFSHCYYLCCAHPEIAEYSLDEDPWPDTYCPSNPKSYELYFDVLEEVIEVFKPHTIHIGHDELYTLCVCPRCKERSAHDLLAEEITKIHDFLAERGIRTILWGDKFMHFTGKPPRRLRLGGVYMRRTDKKTGKTWVMPRCSKAVEKVPPDLMVMDWYYKRLDSSEREFHKHGFDVVYGNFVPLAFENWKKRTRNVPYLLGGEISSWCEVSINDLGHGGIIHNFFPGADMFWSGEKMAVNKVCKLMAQRVTPQIDILSGARRWLVSGGPGKLAHLDLTDVAGPLSKGLKGQLKTGRTPKPVVGPGTFRVLAGAKGGMEKAIVLDVKKRPKQTVAIRQKAKKLLLLHGSTMEGVVFNSSHNKYHRPHSTLLDYTVRYADGKRVTFSAVYGEDIGPIENAWPRAAAGCCFRAVPVAAGKGRTLYAQEWTNPRPNAAIKDVRISLTSDATMKGQVIIAGMSLVV